LCVAVTASGRTGTAAFCGHGSESAGYGGITTVSRITGIAASTIGRGLRELAQNIGGEAGRLRRPGGGRKPLVVTDPGLLPALLALVEPTQRGDPRVLIAEVRRRQ
jgi:hypothetical protein